jgi:predicted acetyltransferase
LAAPDSVAYVQHSTDDGLSAPDHTQNSKHLSKTLHYGFAAADELADAARLITHSFPGPTRTVAWLESQLRSPVWGGGAETLLLGKDGARIVAACQLHPLRQWVAGSRLPCAGIGTVAISPAYRRRSLGAEMMTEALHAALERGDVASALYPFRVSFYQKLGYGQAGEVLQYQVAPQNLPDTPERARVELLDGDVTRLEALELYGHWMRGQNGQLERSQSLWREMVGEHDRCLAGYRGADGGLEGYALLVYRPDMPRAERYVEVDELVATTPAARRGLYAWLASLSDQWEQLLLRALPSERLGEAIREPRLPPGSAPLWRLWAPAAVLLHGTMFRLLDLKAAWQQRAVASGSDLTVGLEVEDAQLAGNAGSWILACREGRTSVESSGRPQLTLRLNISTLSRLYISSLRPSAALHAGLLECDRPDRLPALDAALALPEPWTFDRF